MTQESEYAGEQELITREGQDEVFCQVYVATLSTAKAAIQAYHMEKVNAENNGWRIMKRPHIAARVAFLMERKTHELNIHPNQIIEELKNHAFADHLEVFTDDMLHDLGLDKLTPETRRAIAAIEYDALYQFDDESKTRVKVGNRVKVHWYDKQKALDLLGKVFSLFKDRIEHTGANGTPLNNSGLNNEKAEILAARIGSLLAIAERRMLEQKKNKEEIDDLL